MNDNEHEPAHEFPNSLPPRHPTDDPTAREAGHRPDRHAGPSSARPADRAWIGRARAALRALSRPSGADLRGRILGAARDRAWDLLLRHLGALGDLVAPARNASASTSVSASAPTPTSMSASTSACVAPRWDRHAEAAVHLARRLSGLGVSVALDALPLQWDRSTPESRCAALQAWSWLSAGYAGGRIDGAVDVDGSSEPAYQPSAVPSFLDSLAPR